jgi:hypothetical protein
MPLVVRARHLLLVMAVQAKRPLLADRPLHMLAAAAAADIQPTQRLARAALAEVARAEQTAERPHLAQQIPAAEVAVAAPLLLLRMEPAAPAALELLFFRFRLPTTAVSQLDRRPLRPAEPTPS